MTRYRLTPEASQDLEEILEFLATSRPQAAARLLDSLREKCESLAAMPGIGRPREELAPNLHSSLVGNYVIFYRPSSEGVEILRVLHGARDLPRFFDS